MSTKAQTRIKPLGDRVLVKKFAPAAQTEGGILLPEQSQESQTKGEIVAVGPGKKLLKQDPLKAPSDAWPRIPLDVKPGDHVLFSPYGLESIKQGNDELLLLREEDILAILESE